MAMPGKYIVKLTVDGKTYEQPLTVRMDPRIKTSMRIFGNNLRWKLASSKA